MSITNRVSAVKNERLLILAIALGSILNPLNTTMITVALPSIQKDFQLTSQDISWLVASYFIVSAICLPLTGKISDFYGRKKIFIAGLLLVSISSLLAPLSSSLMFLIGMRTIQAIGTSALFPAGIGIIRTHIEKNQNRVISTLSLFATTSAAFGPTISGLLIQYGGWSVIFYVNFPVLLLSAALAIIHIPSDQVKTGSSFKLDGVGILLFSLFISGWMIFLQTLANGFKVWPFILCLLATAAFYFYEKKKTDPFIDVHFLKKNLNIALTYIHYTLATVVFFAILLSMPTYLQKVLMLNSELAGVTMLSLSVFAMIMTPLSTRWAEKSGFRLPLLFGGAAGIVGVIFLFTANHSSPLFWLVIILAIMGLSNGALNINLQNLLYTFIDKAESGVAAGLLMTSRFLGNILASSLYGISFTLGINDANKNMLTLDLLVVSVILIPGIFYITLKKFSKSEEL